MLENRRRLGLGAVSAFSLYLIHIYASSAPVDKKIEQLSDSPESINADDWITDWVNKKNLDKTLEGPLDLRRFLDPTYILLASISWHPSQANSILPKVVVPKWFVTDFASIPKIFWSIFKPDGNYAYAAVVHDYLYWSQITSRSKADSIFREVMSNLFITDAQAALLYHAVDTFGQTAWNENKKLRLAGERRILTRLPTSSDITWLDWKRKPNVF